MEAGREHGDLLYIRRQRPEKIDTFDGEQFAHLLETDLDLAARNQIAHRRAGWRLLDLRLQLVRDAHALEQAIDFAANSARFNASAELISGFGAPARTATPTPDFARSTRLPGTTLPSSISSSTEFAARMTRSVLSPAFMRFMMSAEPTKR